MQELAPTLSWVDLTLQYRQDWPTVPSKNCNYVRLSNCRYVVLAVLESSTSHRQMAKSLCSRILDIFPFHIDLDLYSTLLLCFNDTSKVSFYEWEETIN